MLNQHRQQVDNNLYEHIAGQSSQQFNKDWHQTVGKAVNQEKGQNLSLTVSKVLHIKVSAAHVIEAGSKAIIQAGMSLSVKGCAKEGVLDDTGQAKVQLPVDKTNVRVEYHSDDNNELLLESSPKKIETPDGWISRMMNKNQGTRDD